MSCRRSSYKLLRRLAAVVQLLILGCTLHVGGVLGISEMRADSTSSFAMRDPTEPKFVITLSSKASPTEPAGYRRASVAAPGGPSELAGAGGGRLMRMTAADGRQYDCELPTMTSAAAEGNQQGADGSLPPDVIEEGAAESAFKLLEALAATCLYRQEGLWTYEMCYKKHTRQFRNDPSGTGEDFKCGEYAGDDEQDITIKADNSSHPYPIRYVSHVFRGGAECVMTGEPRTAEVRFSCLHGVSDNAIVSIREFPTCNYVFVVGTPFLCKHPDFKLPAEQHLGIACKLAQEADSREEAEDVEGGVEEGDVANEQGDGEQHGRHSEL